MIRSRPFYNRGMRIEVLGSIQLRDDKAQAVDVPERKLRALIAVLTAAGGDAVPAEALVDRVWGDSPPQNPTRVLQAKLSQLRALLDQASPGARQMLQRSPAGYSLDITADTLDAAEFRASIRADSTQLSDHQRISVLDRALGLWRGEPYAEFSDELWVGAEASDLHEARLQAVEHCVETLTTAGEHERALAYGAPYLPAHPARETLVAPLLLAYYRSHRQTEALSAYERLRTHLDEELGIEPSPELQDLFLKILRQDPDISPGPASLSAAQYSPAQHSTAPHVAVPEASSPHRRLPAYASPFLGRTEEVGEVLALLRSHRLVTLMGIGGIGKTRLAVEAAEHETRHSVLETWFADLTEISPQGRQNPAQEERAVAHAVAAAMDLPTPRADGTDLTERIPAALQGREVLLVMDNCEHLLEGAATFVERLLRRADGVRILVTSREPLALPEEQRYRVPQLTVANVVPAARTGLQGRDGVEAALQRRGVEQGATEPGAAERRAPDQRAAEQRSPAVDFFLTRVQAVNSEVEIDRSTLNAAEHLCRHLDGLPLALELAAARTNVLSIPELLERITDRLDLLARPGRAAPRRQQTLRGMLDWSWSLLDEEEHALLRRLAVHPASWRLDAIEAICAGASSGSDTAADWPAYGVGISPGRVLAVLSRLVDSSLVATLTTTEGLRYRLLETVHSYAAEHLAASDDQTVVSVRHVTYFRELSECAEIYLFTRQAKGWIGRLAAERGHLAHALTDSLRRDDRKNSAALAMSTFWFRWMTGRIDSLREDLAAVASSPPPEHGAEERHRHAQADVLARSLENGDPETRAEVLLAALERFDDDDGARLHRMRVQWFAGSCLLAHRANRELGESLIDEAIEALLDADEPTWAALASTHRDYFLMDHWGIRPRGLPAGYDVETVLRDSENAYGRIQLLGVRYLVAVADDDASRAGLIADEAAGLADELGLDGEISFWESARALSSIEARDFEAAEHHLLRTREFALRTAYAFCILPPDALEAVLAHRQGDPEHAELLLAGLSQGQRDTARQAIGRRLKDEALPAGLLRP